METYSYKRFINLNIFNLQQQMEVSIVICYYSLDLIDRL